MREGDRMMDNLFPEIKKGIETLIEDEEGNIPGKKLLTLGTMVLILGSLFPLDLFAAHRSHSSHKSHRSHSSGSHGNSSNHESHVSHQSHVSSSNHGSHSSHSSDSAGVTHSNHGSHSNHSNHASHASHTSHSNTGSHSNSRYSAEGDVTYAPEASTIKGVSVPPVETTEELFMLPDVNQNIETPNGTPGAGILPNLGIPASTPGTKIDAGSINQPSATETTE